MGEGNRFHLSYFRFSSDFNGFNGRMKMSEELKHAVSDALMRQTLQVHFSTAIQHNLICLSIRQSWTRHNMSWRGRRARQELLLLPVCLLHVETSQIVMEKDILIEDLKNRLMESRRQHG